MEIWQAVPDWEGLYEVSDLGQVSSVDRRVVALNRAGVLGERLFRGRILAPAALKNGYLMVSLSRPGERRYAYVHDLVMESFEGPKPKGMECCHRNGKRDENTRSNLRYGTRSSNAMDRHDHGTMNQARGESHYFAVLDVDSVKWIRVNSGRFTLQEMANRFGVHNSTIGSVIHRKTWKHVK